MPEIKFDAEIRSVRSMKNLEKVILHNYKEVYGNENSDNDSSDDE